MEPYLQQTKLALIDKSSLEQVHVVIGNEACDLDSAISALVYAYFLYRTSDNPLCLYLPILNIKKEEYRLRTETVFFLRKQGIGDNLLTFRDDIDLHDLHTSGKLKLTLVDHNVLQSQDASLEEDVVSVIDHHVQERTEKPGVKVILDMVGSCCTLVAEELLSHPSFVIDQQVALLLYGTILVDTVNTLPEAGKTTPHDLAVVEKLGQMLPDIRDELYHEIQEAKLDLSGLTKEEILEKDLKIVRGSRSEIAMSSITMDMMKFLSRPDIYKDIEQFCAKKNATASIIMTFSQNEAGHPERQIAVFSKDDIIRDQMINALLKANDPSLDLELLTSGNSFTCVYQQRNVKASRKKVLPLVKLFLKDFETRNMDKEKSSEQNTNSLVDLNFPQGKSQSEASRTNQSDLYVTSASASENENQNHNKIKSDSLSEFDPFSNEPVSPVQIYLDNEAVEGSGLGELNEADILEPPTTPDILVSGTNGYFSGNSSTHTSEPGSGFPSYPVTPPNSYTVESSLGNYNNLPSFNSSEMVQKIQQKKLGAYGAYNESFESELSTSVPFTPQNSQIESPMEGTQREISLPSFNSSDMVQRIKQKRSSMGGNSASFEYGEGDSLFLTGSSSGGVGSAPFTPHNSFVDSSFPSFKENMDFDAGQLQHRLEGIQKIAPSGRIIRHSVSEQKSEETLSPIDERNTADLSFSGYLDSNRNPKPENLSKNQPENQSSPRENVDDVKNVSMETEQSVSQESVSSETKQNVVSRNIAKEMIDDMLKNSVNLKDSHENDNDFQGGNGDMSSDRSSGNHGNDPSARNPLDRTNENVPDSSSSAKDIKKKKECLDLQNLEDAMYSLAGEIIKDALDSFPDTSSPVVKEALNRWSLDELIDSASNGDDIFTQYPTAVTNFKDGYQKTPSTSSLTIETDYLSKVDPYHGNLNILGDMSTKEVIESSSFRKMSREIPEFCLDIEDAKNKYGETDDVNGEHTEEQQVNAVNSYAKNVAENVITSAISSMTDQPKEEIYSPKSETTDSSELSSTTTEGSYRINDSLISSPDVVPGGTLPKSGGGDDENSRNSKTVDENTKESFDRQISEQTSISSESLSSYSGARSDLSFLENNRGSFSTQKSFDFQFDQPESDSTKEDNSFITFKANEEFSELNVNTLESEIAQNIASSKLDNSKKHKEVYLTTAGRISLPSDSAVETEGQRSPSSGVKNPSVSSEMILEESKFQVKKMVARADNLIAQVDATLAFLKGDDLCLDSDDPCMLSDDPCMDVFTQNTDEAQKPPANMVRRKHPSSSSTDKEKFKDVEFTEEWQDDDIPGMPREEEDSDDEEDSSDDEDEDSSDDSSTEKKPKRPTSFAEVNSKRKITADLDLLNDVGKSSGEIGDDELENDAPPTPDDPETSELEWENDTPITTPSQQTRIPEFTAEEEYKEAKHWRGVEVGGKQRKIDLRVIEPYKKVLSHGGYYGDGLNAIIIFSGCFLPDRGRKDYQYVMDNLFLYVLSTLELLVAEDYMIVYFHGATPRRQMPSFGWLKRCYQMIDRRLKKNLKALLLVHPTLWLKTVVIMTRPFISTKFSSKLRFVKSLHELNKIIPMEYIFVPDQVQQYDDRLTQRNTSTSSPSSPSTSPPSPS